MNKMSTITLDKPHNVELLFDITKEIKHFYETPVIFVTHKDYSDPIFNTMCKIRSTLSENALKSEILDIIVDFHLQWLHAVNEIENFNKIVTDIPREDLYQAISYTIDAMGHRLKYFQKYVEKNRPLLTNLEQAHMQTELELVEEMHRDVTHVLLEKLKCFRNFTGDTEFKIKVKDAVEDLLQWLDKINDGLAIQLSKVVNINLPHLSGDLNKTLQQIVDKLTCSQSPSSQKMLDKLKQKGKEISTMIRSTSGHFLEISKVMEKINILEDRIKRLEDENSSAVMALKHKKQYLEQRLTSLENLKTSLKTFHTNTELKFDNAEEEELCTCEDFYQLRIFNHLLPPPERERLVTELCNLWGLAIFGDKRHRSVISILSAPDMKEEFSDEHGTFYVDEFSRKIYKLPDDETKYQQNEKNELVPVSDDLDHVYFYDECGRYYIDSKNRQRVYKAHLTASEYMMDSSGILLKIREERDGVTFYYDNYGRYYINEEGKHIYREADAVSEYENDGLGNLVRIRSHNDIFDTCPDDVHVTEDCKYLKQTVGTALRQCIADVILHQPADPIKYLSSALLKYRENIELRDITAREKEALNIEREIKQAEEREAAERAALEAAMLLDQGGSETSYDSNLMNYRSSHPDNDFSAVSSSKN